MNENTQVIKEAYENFGSGNIDGLIDLMAEDISWTTPEINGSPLAAVSHGSENVRQFFETLAETEEFTHFEPREFIAEGNRVVVLGRSVGTVKATRQNFETEWVHIYSVSDGKITSFSDFLDTAVMERAFQRSATA